MEEYILGIDQGTTGTKVLVFDTEFRVVARAYKELTQYYPRPGWVEHDPEEIWLTTCQLMQEVLNDERYIRGLRGIAITNQRETTIVWDRRTGVPLHPAIVWQCRRSAEICQDLREAGYEPLIRAKTGLLLDPYFSGTKVRWLIENSAQVRDLAKRGDLAFGTVDSWLIWKLTGGRVHATDYSNASRTLIFNCAELKWDDELAELMRVPLSALPDVRDSAGYYGETIAHGRLPAGVPIAGVIGDSQGALFGHACFEPGMTKATYGTGTSLMMNAGPKWRSPAKGLVSTVAWRLNGEVTYALEGIIHTTGAAIQWLRDGLGILSDAAESEELARMLHDNEGVYLVPAFVGLGIPYWDPEARAIISGITRGTTRAHLARAALESIAYQVRDAMEAMIEATGISLTELCADGGASANTFLMQFQADILGRPVSCSAIQEVSLLGAVYLAGIGLGLLSGYEDIAHRTGVMQKYLPRMSGEERRRLYYGWKQAVRRALSATECNGRE